MTGTKPTQPKNKPARSTMGIGRDFCGVSVEIVSGRSGGSSVSHQFWESELVSSDSFLFDGTSVSFWCL